MSRFMSYLHRKKTRLIISVILILLTLALIMLAIFSVKAVQLGENEKHFDMNVIFNSVLMFGITPPSLLDEIASQDMFNAMIIEWAIMLSIFAIILIIDIKKNKIYFIQIVLLSAFLLESILDLIVLGFNALFVIVVIYSLLAIPYFVFRYIYFVSQMEIEERIARFNVERNTSLILLIISIIYAVITTVAKIMSILLGNILSINVRVLQIPSIFLMLIILNALSFIFFAIRNHKINESYSNPIFLKDKRELLQFFMTIFSLLAVSPLFSLFFLRPGAFLNDIVNEVNHNYLYDILLFAETLFFGAVNDNAGQIHGYIAFLFLVFSLISSILILNDYFNKKNSVLKILSTLLSSYFGFLSFISSDDRKFIGVLLLIFGFISIAFFFFMKIREINKKSMIKTILLSLIVDASLIVLAIIFVNISYNLLKGIDNKPASLELFVTSHQTNIFNRLYFSPFIISLMPTLVLALVLLIESMVERKRSANLE